MWVCLCACAWVSGCMCMIECVWLGVGVAARALASSCACRLTYPVCNARKPYCLPSVWFYHAFRHYLLTTWFSKKKKKLLNLNMFLFSPKLLFETYFFIRRIQPDTVINVKSLHVKHPFLSDFNKTRFCRQISEKLKYQILLGSVQWEQSFSMWTDGRTVKQLWRS